jgi:phage terminase small subunit
MNRKQKVFVAEYLKCWNASKAARRAGYSAKTAYAIGSELLRKPEIKELVDTCLAEIQMSADEAIVRNTQVGRGDLGDFFRVVDEWTFYPLPSSDILEYREVDENEGKEDEDPKIRTSYRVRRVVLDVDKLVDPRFSHLVKKFTDSPKNGLGVELYDAQTARKLAMQLAGKLTEKMEVKQSGETKVIIEYADSKDTAPETTPSADADQESAQEV